MPAPMRGMEDADPWAHAPAPAQLAKRVTAHTFRHSFATHLLEQGWDIRQVQTLLGHANLETTMVYTHVVNKPAITVRSPLDRIEAPEPGDGQSHWCSDRAMTRDADEKGLGPRTWCIEPVR